MVNGTIVRLVHDRGFGFIGARENIEYFFHATALQGVRFDALQEGQRVEFEVEVGSVRGPRARLVTVAAGE